MNFKIDYYLIDFFEPFFVWILVPPSASANDELSNWIKLSTFNFSSLALNE